MKQSGHLNPSEESRICCPVTSKYGRTPPNKHGGVGRQQQQQQQATRFHDEHLRSNEDQMAGQKD